MIKYPTHHIVQHVILLIVFNLAIISLYGQDFRLSGKVIDSERSEELPYANIMVKNHFIGTSSDIHGVFDLYLADFLRNDTLIITYVGYSPLVLCLKDFKNGIVKLVPLNIKIGEVIIKPTNKKTRPLFVNQFNQNNCGVRYSPINNKVEHWIPYRPQEPTIEALYFPYKEEYGENRRLKEVKLQVSNFKTPPTYFNIRIFKASGDLMPDEDLLIKSLTIEVTEKNQLIKVDLEKYNLIMPENGLFIGFELLIIDENKSTIYTEKDSTYTLYSPYLNFISLEGEQHFWLYSKGRWIETFQKTLHPTKRDVMLFYKPAISLVLVN